MNVTDYKTAYDYAVRNGYAGTSAEYWALQYEAYIAVCSRCDIAPMPQSKWEKPQ